MRAFTKSTEYELSGKPGIMIVLGIILSESRRRVSLVMATVFLRRLDKGFSVRGAWAAANSSPVQKSKHNIRTFPINQLVFLFIETSFNGSPADSSPKEFYITKRTDSHNFT